MSTFAFLFLCIQACLLQSVYGQCPWAGMAGPALAAPGLAGGYSMGALAPAAAIAPAAGLAPWGAGLAAPLGYAGLAEAAYAPYGGVGEGNVAVIGELPVAGNTAVAGQVPIMGAVSFGGAVPAAGAVSIAGQCACGCGAAYDYAGAPFGYAGAPYLI